MYILYHGNPLPYFSLFHSLTHCIELPISSRYHPWLVDEAEVAENGRRDLRNLFIMSIDPKGCEDVDDALSIR